MDPPSGGGGNDSRARSGEKSTVETFWSHQEAIDSSGLPSDASLLAYLHSQGTEQNMKNDLVVPQVLIRDSTVPNLPNVPSTQREISDFLMTNSHAFDQEQAYDGKLAAAASLAPKSLEQARWNTSTTHQDVKQQLDANFQGHGGMGFRQSDHWGRSGEMGEALASSSVNHPFMPLYGGTSSSLLPGTMRWSSSSSSATTDFGAESRSGNVVGRDFVSPFRLPSPPNLLMSMHNNEKARAYTTKPLQGQMVTIAGRPEITIGSSSPSSIWTLSQQEESEGRNATMNAHQQGGMNERDRSSSGISHQTSLVGQFEPSLLWRSMPEELQGPHLTSLDRMTTGVSNQEGNTFTSSQRNTSSSVATTPSSLDRAMTSTGQPMFWDNITSSINFGNFPGTSSLTASDMLANEATTAVDLIRQHQMHQNVRRMEEQSRVVPRGMAIRTCSTTPEALNSEHERDPHKQLDAEGKEDSSDCKYTGNTSSTVTNATSSAGIGAWSAASAELLDDLEVLTREKTNRFKKKFTNKPKRPLSAYNIFFKEERERILREIPDDAAATTAAVSSSSQGSSSSRIRRGKRTPHGKIDFQSLAKAVGKRWQNLSAEAMAVYKEKANDDLVRYKQEMEEFTTKAARSFDEFTELQGEGGL